jgi:hypothetical protein
MHLLLNVVLSFLPFIVSLWGLGKIWKFLSFLFSFMTLGGLLLLPIDVVPMVITFLAWAVGWVFAGVARSRKSAYLGTDDAALRRNIRRP